MRMLALAVLVAPLWAATWRADVEFARAGDIPLTLDASIPDGAGPFAAVIVVHGGGFIAGDKQTYVKPLFEPLTGAGFAWFTINYRQAPEHPFPAAVEDVWSAIRHVRTHAAGYKVDPERMALVGESAGGHLVSFAGAKAPADARVAAVVSFYGPHDFEARERALGALSTNVKAFLAVSELNPETYRKMREASPITHVHPGMPPYLLIHGTKDPTVPYDQSVRMCESMRQAGASCEIFTVDGGGHGVGNWEKTPAFQAYKERMIDWLRARLK